MTKAQIICMANALLLKNGYDLDGSKRKSVPLEQKFFEKVIIIKTPMGNHR